MTFIQPNKRTSYINKVLIALIAVFVVAVFWVVMLYNIEVNLNHGLADMKGQLQTIQADNAAAKEKLFSLINSGNFKALAAGKNLVQDKNPEYLEIHSQWSYASEF